MLGWRLLGPGVSVPRSQCGLTSPGEGYYQVTVSLLGGSARVEQALSLALSLCPINTKSEQCDEAQGSVPTDDDGRRPMTMAGGCVMGHVIGGHVIE